MTLALPKGASLLDPRARPFIEAQIDDAKARALERFLEVKASDVVAEIVQPLTDELTRLILSKRHAVI